MGVTGCPGIDAGSSRDKGRAGHDGNEGAKVLHCVCWCWCLIEKVVEEGWKCGEEKTEDCSDGLLREQNTGR